LIYDADTCVHAVAIVQHLEIRMMCSGALVRHTFHASELSQNFIFARSLHPRAVGIRYAPTANLRLMTLPQVSWFRSNVMLSLAALKQRPYGRDRHLEPDEQRGTDARALWHTSTRGADVR
jgi:hypothetical protein